MNIDNDEIQLKIDKIPYILCKHNQQITQVCLEKSCLENNEFLVCSACDYHTNHENISLKLLINDIF